ncbi:MAG: deoxyribose-phosphate aldolase [Calditrichaeota bacterium]|nr:deoxyribose-phosphate aldolase [Calditrichota bacterium]MCB9368861.1 deoxyribose-phosphate aldolase [Calditrichota bacterium]
MTKSEAAALIDHTILKAEATAAQIDKLCDEALKLNFKTVCVNARFVPQCAKKLAGSEVSVCTVVGFPLGATSTESKVAEALQAIHDGATEIDMVLWIGGMLSGDFAAVEHDIRAVADACRRTGASLKVIFETAMLSESQIVKACELCVKAKAQWVKTSTGFGPGGATLEAVALMHKEVAAHGLKVKASGGIRTLADFEKMIQAGAERIGTSSGAAILNEIA